MIQDIENKHMLEKGRSVVDKGIAIMSKGRVSCTLYLSFLWWLLQFGVLLFTWLCLLCLLPALVLSAKQSLFQANHSHAALSSVVFSKFNLLILIMFLAQFRKLLVSPLPVSREDLSWL